jgi:GT2 family glycosyltransferase
MSAPVRETPSPVTVVVPNWNGVSHLPECLAALASQTRQDFELIVVDNASTDTSVQWLEENAPTARIVRRAVNGGVSACINSGIRTASGEYIVVLMNDTAPEPEWLESLVSALADGHYDSAASSLVFYAEPDTINAAGDIYHLGSLSGDQRGRGKLRSDFSQPVRVLGACGGAAAYRRSFFDDVGLFDEDFFMTHEDTDLNIRGLVAGKRCLYVPTAVIRHKDSATIREQPGALMRRLEARNRGIVAMKDLPAVLLPLVIVGWPYRLFRSTIPLRPSLWGRIPVLVREVPMRVTAEWEGWRIGWSKRRDVWSRQAVSTGEIVRWLFRGVGPA